MPDVRRLWPAISLAAFAVAVLGCGSRGPTAPEEAPALTVAPPETAQRAPRSDQQNQNKAAKNAGTPGAHAPSVPGGATKANARDKASQHVAKYLEPSEETFVARLPGPRLAGTSAMERPELPTPPPPELIRLPIQPPSSALRPGRLPVDSPLTQVRTDPRLPGPNRLPAGALAKVPAPDPEMPPPLPILARPDPDREPLTDVSLPLSTEAALAARPPVRVAPFPFDRPAVSDPFEHRQAVRMNTVPREPLPAPQLLPRTPPKHLEVK